MSWQLVKIGDVCKTGAGGTPLKSQREYYDNGTIPWLLSGEVSQGEIFASKNFITESGLQNSSAKIFPKNTVLVAMYGATAGQVGILRLEAATNQAVCGIYPNENLLPEYIFYAVLYKQSDLIATAAGNAQPNISQIKVKNTEIPLPKLPEQKRTIGILDEAFAGIDTAIANTEKNLTNARELFESYLNSVFSQKSEVWKEKTIGELVTLARGHNPPKSKFIYEPKEGYVRFYQIRDGKTDDYTVYVPDTPQLHKVEPDDILMVAYRHIGKVFRGASGAFNVALCKLTNKDRTVLLDDYLFYIIPTKYIRGELLKRSERSLIPSMSVKHLSGIQIPLPPMPEQRRLVEQLDVLHEEIQRIENIYKQKINSLSELKQSLLQKAFSGELTAETKPVKETIMASGMSG